MADYDNKGRWVLFRNEKKTTDTQPDYTGTLTLLDGTECYLDAWLKESKNGGKKFFSGKYKPKDSKAPADSSGEESQDAPF